MYRATDNPETAQYVSEDRSDHNKPDVRGDSIECCSEIKEAELSSLARRTKIDAKISPATRLKPKGM